MERSVLRGVPVGVALLGCLLAAGCAPPPGAGPLGPTDSVTAQEVQRERALYPGIEKRNIDPTGRLEVFTTSLLTDGRNVKVRGTLHNSMPEPVSGVRLIFRLYPGGPEGGVKPLDAIQKEKSIHLGSGETTALRWDIQTMYADGLFRFTIEAYAKRVGDREIPPPPGWRE
jgi:hypothetical protein